MSNLGVPPAFLRRVPAWVNVLVVVCAVLMAVGAMIGFVNPEMLVHDSAANGNATVRLYANYFAVRNLALSLMLLALLFAAARRALGTMVAVVGLIQLLDFVVDCVDARWTVAPGVLVLGILLLLAARRISGAAFWRRGAWG